MSPPARRSVYRRAELTRLLEPARIAIVGASTNPTSFAAATMKRLARFRGEVACVNPRYAEIDGRPCYPDIRSIPSVPDCVIVAVPGDGVEAIVRECADAGVGGAILYASGYSETGKPANVERQQRLADIARGSALRIAGPNCIGLANYGLSADMSFFSTDLPNSVGPAAVGVISQSGALGNALAQSMRTGTALSHLLTSGNSCDVDVADYIAYLAETPQARAIACLFEGISDPMRFLEAAEIAWRADKPLVVHKIATGETGRAAAMSHTGSLAGSNEAWRALFEQAGATEAVHFEGLLETARYFAKSAERAAATTTRRAEGVAVIAGSGGASVMAADAAEHHGVPLPQPSEAGRRELERHIPDFGSSRNPCDVTAQVTGNPGSILACFDALLAEPCYGTLVLPNPFAAPNIAERSVELARLARKYGKLGCFVSLSQWMDGTGNAETEQSANIAVFRSMDRCFAAIAAWNRREQRRGWPIVPSRRLSPAAAAAETAGALKPGRGAIGEREAKKILAAYGIPVVADEVATSAAAARAAAGRCGFPVVLKIESPDIAHKTEAGGVRLNLRSADEVARAWEEIVAAVRMAAPTARIDGVLVQPMIGSGVEMMMGARIDPLFGPLVVTGFGGVLVELLRDTVTALAPLSQESARRLFDRLERRALLAGFRGQPPVELDRLAEIVARFSEFVADNRDLLSEVDVNPLVCSQGRITAVDALIVTKQYRAKL